MKKILTNMVIVVGMVCFVNGAEKHEHDHEHGHAQEHDHDHGHEHAHGAGVEVGEAAAQAMGLKTVRVEKRRMRSTVSLLGRFELAPDARSCAASPVAGRISLKVRSLQTVKAGDVLFTVDVPDLRAKAKEIEILGRRLKVYHELKRASAELEAQLALRQAEREALLAGAEERDGIVSVRAAVAGRVEALSVLDGAWVSSGTSVVEMMRPERVRFKALVTSSEVVRLKDGMKAQCGKAVGILKLGFGDESGLTSVYAVFGEGYSARPGERASVDCVTDESEVPSLVVPTASIVRVGLEPTVFVRDEHDPDRYLAVKVSPGRENGRWTEVTGLPDDDDLEVVQEGAYELKIALAAQSGSTPAGHFHADGTFHEGKDEH